MSNVSKVYEIVGDALYGAGVSAATQGVLRHAIEDLLERALAEQREAIADAIHETRKPGNYMLTHEHAQIAREFGKEKS